MVRYLPYITKRFWILIIYNPKITDHNLIQASNDNIFREMGHFNFIMAGMKNINSIQDIVAQIYTHGGFPEGAFELREIENIKSFEFVSDEKVRFRIKQRLGLGDQTMPEDSLSAYIPKTYVFELDWSKRKLSLIEQIEGTPVIHFRILAIEQVEKYFNKIEIHENMFRKTKTEKDVVEYAEREIAHIIIGDDFGNDIKKASEGENIPKDSFDRFLTEFKKQYISKMVHQWLIFRNLQDLL